MRAFNVHARMLDVAVDSKKWLRSVKFQVNAKNGRYAPCDHLALLGDECRELTEDVAELADATFDALHCVEARSMVRFAFVDERHLLLRLQLVHVECDLRAGARRLSIVA